MSSSVLVTVFSQGLGLIAVLAIGYGVIERLSMPSLQRQLILGLWFGAGAILAMTAPAQLSEGLIVDVRCIIVGMGAAFGGPVTAILATILAAIYRIYLGGMGALPGTLAIVLAGIIGFLGGRYLNKNIYPTLLRYAALGFLISLNFGVILNLCVTV